MEKFTDVWETLESYNADRQKFYPTTPAMTQEEFNTLLGRYASSTIRYSNRTQFKLAFMSINVEAQERLRAKLMINTKLRNLVEEEALEGNMVVINNATNPDTEPSTEAFSPLPYVNGQTAQKEKIGKVGGLYNWKHSVGGQAYNEYLDMFKRLFKVVLEEEITVYEQ